ncbi:MDR family MFS transporter [Paenibacillus filicis]|uniref:MDR family MFS transporter n=1 Tax=Paenibacillus filicis TaxID=669464 RepID=A0ABU9DIL0_9BACL
MMTSLLVCGFVGMFSETALNIAISHLMEVFHISASAAQWLTTGYLLTLGILMPMTGLLLQWFTSRQLFIISLVSSITGTLIASLAFGFEMLLAARVLQAIGMSLLLPLLFNMILVAYPPEKRGAAMGSVGLVIMFAPAIAPSLSGLLIEYLSWRYIFGFSLPLLGIGLLIGLRYLENVTKRTKPPIDLLSIVLSTVGFGSVVFGFSKAGEAEAGWTSMAVTVFLLIGIVFLALFALRQLTIRQPLLNLSVFRYPMFTVGQTIILIGMLIIVSSMIILPIYLQNSLKFSAFTTGLLLLPGSALNGILSPSMGRLFDKHGPKRLVIPGFLVIASTLGFYCWITASSSAGWIVALHIGLMVGISMVMMPAQTNALNQLPPALHPHGTAVMSTLQQVTGAIGTAIAVSLLSRGTDTRLQDSMLSNSLDRMADAIAFGSRNAFFFSLIVSIIGLIVAIFIRRVVVKRAG